MSPTMRPSSTCRSMPSSATVEPKVLRRPRASMHAMDSALLLCRVRRGRAVDGGFQALLRVPGGPVGFGRGPPPFPGQELLAFAPQQQFARAGIDEHAAAALALHELLVDELLVALQ